MRKRVHRKNPKDHLISNHIECLKYPLLYKCVVFATLSVTKFCDTVFLCVCDRHESIAANRIKRICEDSKTVCDIYIPMFVVGAVDFVNSTNKFCEYCITTGPPDDYTWFFDHGS
jgi:hypothetical protein